MKSSKAFNKIKQQHQKLVSRTLFQMYSMCRVASRYSLALLRLQWTIGVRNYFLVITVFIHISKSFVCWHT